MRILVLGAAGFIGAAIVAALQRAGHQVRCVVRGPAATHLQVADADLCTMRLDHPATADAAAWIPMLNGVDGVVNAAGVLQPTVAAHAWAVHRDAPDALYRACERVGVRRVIHVSAAGIEASETLYARSKRAGEAALAARDLDWTVVRPVVVVGDGSYGGTSLIRALSAFPFAIPLVGQSDAQIGVIHKDDLAAGIAALFATGNAVGEMVEASDAGTDDPGPDGNTGKAVGQVVEACGSGRYSLAELLRAYRRWLGAPGVRSFRVPMPVARAVALLGDVTNAQPISTTTLAQAQTPLGGDSGSFIRATGIEPRSLDEILSARPADTQDLWHARLFLLKPALRLMLAAMWAVSGLVVLLPDTFAALASSLPLPGGLARAVVLGACLFDLAIAAALFRHLRPALVANIQIVAVLGYTVAVGWVQPLLWVDPFGPLVKNVALLALLLVHRVLEQER